MAIEIVDFPIKNGDFPWQNVSSPEGKLYIQKIHDHLPMNSLSLMNRLVHLGPPCAASTPVRPNAEPPPPVDQICHDTLSNSQEIWVFSMENEAHFKPVIFWGDIMAPKKNHATGPRLGQFGIHQRIF